MRNKPNYQKRLRDTALRIKHEARKLHDTPTKGDIAKVLEQEFVLAAWTLRRLPTRDRPPSTLGAAWQDEEVRDKEYNDRYRARISAQEVDHMQPTLDLLLLLPDLGDRQLVFWACHHVKGEVSDRIPWSKVRESMGGGASRWTLKRHYEGALLLLGAIINLQLD